MFQDPCWKPPVVFSSRIGYLFCWRINEGFGLDNILMNGIFGQVWREWTMWDRWGMKGISVHKWAMKKTWLFTVYRGWNPTQLNGDYFINHDIRIPFLNNQDSSRKVRDPGFFWTVAPLTGLFWSLRIPLDLQPSLMEILVEHLSGQISSRPNRRGQPKWWWKVRVPSPPKSP